MKAFKITLVLLVLATFGVAIAMAQGNRYDNRGRGYHNGYGHGYGGYHHRGNNRILWMKDYLKLSDSQVEKIIKINSDFRIKYYKSRNNRDAYLKLRENHRKAILTVFNAKQKKLYNEGFNNRNNDRRGSRRGYGRGYGNCQNY